MIEVGGFVGADSSFFKVGQSGGKELGGFQNHLHAMTIIMILGRLGRV